MVWKPPKALGLGVGFVIVFTIVGIDAFLVYSMTRQSPGLNALLIGLIFVASLPLLGLYLLWLYDLWRMRYYMDHNVLVISGGSYRYHIPLDRIQRIVPGTNLTVSHGFRGIGWPGYLNGRMHLRGLGKLLVYSTEPLERQLIVVTDAVCFGISPDAPEAFLEDYLERRKQAPTREARFGLEYLGLRAWPLWRDRGLAVTLALALVANLGLYGLVTGLYGGLPDSIPFHFDALGLADRMAAKDWILLVPSIGMLALAANTVLSIIIYRHERFGAYLLTCAALGIQVMVWLAAVGILLRA